MTARWAFGGAVGASGKARHGGGGGGAKEAANAKRAKKGCARARESKG